MKGDFSRDTFVPAKHYSAVLMQQGRVQVDADWNEQQAISRHLTEAEGWDVIGHCGAPEFGGGFNISVAPSGEDLLISPGSMYIDGILCEAEHEPPIPVELNQNGATILHWPTDGRKFKLGQWVLILAVSSKSAPGFPKVARITGVDLEGLKLKFDIQLEEIDNENSYTLSRITTYLTQPDYPEPAYADKPSPSEWVTLKLADGLHLVYLDVWQRHITALEDSHILEKAVGAPDTTTRMKTVWQVKILSIRKKPAAFEITEEAGEIANPKAREFVMNFRRDGMNFAYDQESCMRLMPYGVQARKVADTLAPDERNIFDRILDTVDFWKETIAAWINLIAPSTGTLNVRTRLSNSTETLCSLSPEAGYQRLENQLYRVEIHKGSLEQGGPTFKWSRDNGSVVAAVEKISEAEITIKDLRDDTLRFGSGQWVEVLDDKNELNNLPGQFVKILERIREDSGGTILRMESQVTPLAEDDEGVDKALHPKIRRWDHWRGATRADIPLDTKGWVTIDDSIEVKFSESTYKTGDYWLIPARTAKGNIEWPPYDDPKADPIPQLPLGVKHHYCALAWIIAAKKEKSPIVEVSVAKDLRTIYYRLPVIRTAILDIESRLAYLEQKVKSM